MAKPNKKKTRPSWFQRQVEQGGPDFLLRKAPNEIQRDALNIMRDIARGNITKRDYEYLFNLKILSNVRIALMNKYIEFHTIDASLSFIQTTGTGFQVLENVYKVAPGNFQRLFNNTKDNLTAYMLMINGIDAFINFIQSPFPKAEEDYEQICSSVYFQLAKFKHII